MSRSAIFSTTWFYKALSLIACIAMLFLCSPNAYAFEEATAVQDSLVQAQSSVIASGTWGECAWSIDSDGLLTIEPANGVSGTLAEPVNPSTSGWGTNDRLWPWRDNYGIYEGKDYRSQVTSVKVLPGVKAGRSTCDMFLGMELQSLDIDGLDTSGTIDFTTMFAEVKAPLSAVSRLDVGNAEDFGGMFSNAESSDEVDLSCWDADKALLWDMFQKFRGPSVKVPLNAVRDPNTFNRMFAGAVIGSLDITGLQVSDAQQSYNPYFWMFGPGYGVTELDSFTVGPTVAFGALEALPSIDSEDGRWWSTADQCWYSADEVKASRSGIADTYCSHPSSARDLSNDLEVSLSQGSFDYDGTPKEPIVDVRWGGVLLDSAKDYSISYVGSKDVGTAAVYIQLIPGSFDGCVGRKVAYYQIVDGSDYSNSEGNEEAVTDDPIGDYKGDGSKPAENVSKPATGEAGGVAADAAAPGNSSHQGAADVPGASAGANAVTSTAKSANTLKVKAKTVTLKAKKLKKKAQSVKASKAFSVTDAQGKVTYKVSKYDKKAKKKLTVSKSGKVTAKKGLAKGAYKLKVRITAVGDAAHEPAAKTVTLKVRVK